MVTEPIHSDLPIPPGEFLEEVIEDLGMTKDELARRMNRPAPKLSAIFKGDKAITPDTALQLEKVVGVSAHIWTGLEAEYRLTLARLEQNQARDRLKAETRLITRFRYAELVKMGVVEKFTRPEDKVLALHKFLGVTSLETIANLKRYQPAFRKGPRKYKGYTPQAVAAWLRIGEVQAQKCGSTPFDENKFKRALLDIRAITGQSPESFQEPLHKGLAGVGVVLVLCPPMPDTGIQGATFWVGSDKAVVMMTHRYKWADIFWFSLFHELGHILLHGRNTVILESTDPGQKHQQQEDQADRFAADTLIPAPQLQKMVAAKQFFKEDIETFASQVGIDPGIVVGRLQHEGHLREQWHNGLRKRFEW